jgi:hypothetical protein
MPNQALQQTPPQWIFGIGCTQPCGVAAELVVRRLAGRFAGVALAMTIAFG